MLIVYILINFAKITNKSMNDKFFVNTYWQKRIILL